MPPMLPCARSAGLSVVSVPGDSSVTLVDAKKNRKHRLHPFTAWVWQNADGSQSVSQLSVKAKLVFVGGIGGEVNEAMVWQAIDDLAEAGLMQSGVAPPAGVTRRSAFWKVAATGLAASAVIGVGKAVHAQEEDANDDEDATDDSYESVGINQIVPEQLLIEAKEDLGFSQKDLDLDESEIAAEQQALALELSLEEKAWAEEELAATAALSLDCASPEPLELGKGWQASDGYDAPTVTVRGGLAHITGLVVSTGDADPVLAKLPSNCRPRGNLIFGQLSFVPTNKHEAVTRVDVLPDGSLMLVSGGTKGSWVTLSGITFPIAVTSKEEGAACRADARAQESREKLRSRRNHQESAYKRRSAREELAKQRRRVRAQERTSKFANREESRKRVLGRQEQLQKSRVAQRAKRRLERQRHRAQEQQSKLQAREQVQKQRELQRNAERDAKSNQEQDTKQELQLRRQQEERFKAKQEEKSKKS